MPTTRRQMLEGAALCEPLAHGALDGLCGLYAAINAIRVVLAPERGMRRGEVKQLFDAGVMHLAESEAADRAQALHKATGTVQGRVHTRGIAQCA